MPDVQSRLLKKSIGLTIGLQMPGRLVSVKVDQIAVFWLDIPTNKKQTRGNTDENVSKRRLQRLRISSRFRNRR